MMYHIQKTLKTPSKLLELKNLGKLQDLQSKQKSPLFLFINNELSKGDSKKIPYTIASKKTKHLGINLTNEVKDQYSEKRKTLMKEMEDGK